MRLAAIIAVVLTTNLSGAAAQAPRDCVSLWKAADADSNGVLTRSEDSRGYFDAFKVSRLGPVEREVITRDEFVHYCEGRSATRKTTKDQQESAKGPAGLGREGPGDLGKGDMTPGLIPFPKSEARSRLQAVGYRGLGELTLDEKGIWRTTAMFQGRQVDVAVDVQGEILAGN